MSAHRCIRCQKKEKPDLWMWYDWLPQPGEYEGSQYWVLCDPCDTALTRAAFEAEVGKPSSGDWHKVTNAELSSLIQLVGCPRCKVAAWIPCTSPKVPVVFNYVHQERISAALTLGFGAIGNAPNKSSTK